MGRVRVKMSKGVWSSVLDELGRLGESGEVES